MINIPKGTKDVLPSESRKWQYAEGKLRGVAALYNAPTTISQYYASLVSHDLAQDAAGI